jgi:hypothetical protein
MPGWGMEWSYFGRYIIKLNVNPSGARAVIPTSATLLSFVGRRDASEGLLQAQLSERAEWDDDR